MSPLWLNWNSAVSQQCAASAICSALRPAAVILLGFMESHPGLCVVWYSQPKVPEELPYRFLGPPLLHCCLLTSILSYEVQPLCQPGTLISQFMRPSCLAQASLPCDAVGEVSQAESWSRCGILILPVVSLLKIVESYILSSFIDVTQGGLVWYQLLHHGQKKKSIG